ncbi:hypothetical protein [Streptomyces sp. NPDC097981]|uniref:hypothetical protein n=1 Tax=Streptomyces sp. NPDC097981 TaxID=3155428 RepID=UPI003333F35C
MKIRHALTTGLAGAALVVGLTGGTANATSSWTGYRTPADVAGATAWGQIDPDGVRITLDVNIKDTNTGDAYGARVRIRTTYNDGGVRPESLSASNTSPVNHTTWNYAGNAIRFEIMECTTKAGADYRCGSWYTIWQR